MKEKQNQSSSNIVLNDTDLIPNQNK